MGVAISGAVSDLTQFFNRIGPSAVPDLKWQSTEVLDKSYGLLLQGRVSDGMDLLAAYLLAVRREEDPLAWEQFATTVLRHPVGQLVWQDPFTQHSFRKPRGYAGDACLLDYLYRRSEVPLGTSELGRQVFEYMMDQLGARSVRSRRDILARAIDEAAEQVHSPRILSIACGHLREAAFSKALAEGRIGEFVAFDQDAESLAEVQREFGQMGVHAVQGSVRSILAGKVRFEEFDLVYAAGLYDYLADRVAARLTRLLFDMLAPGGRLIVANFAPCLPETGYMETFMGWTLLYRWPREVHQFGQDIADDEWKSNRLFWDEHESIIFLDLAKRQARLKVVEPPAGTRFVVPGLKRVTLKSGPGGDESGGNNGNGSHLADDVPDRADGADDLQ